MRRYSVHLSISLNQQFEPYILRWLEETDTKTLTWVRNAINLDSFRPEDSITGEEHDEAAEKYTSSIRDLVDSCKGALQFVTDLDWPDEYQNATFITRLSSVSLADPNDRIPDIRAHVFVLADYK